MTVVLISTVSTVSITTVSTVSITIVVPIRFRIRDSGMGFLLRRWARGDAKMGSWLLDIWGWGLGIGSFESGLGRWPWGGGKIPSNLLSRV